MEARNFKKDLTVFLLYSCYLRLSTVTSNGMTLIFTVFSVWMTS
jgi:hypothetical protein